MHGDAGALAREIQLVRHKQDGSGAGSVLVSGPSCRGDFAGRPHWGSKMSRNHDTRPQKSPASAQKGLVLGRERLARGLDERKCGVVLSTHIEDASSRQPESDQHGAWERGFSFLLSLCGGRKEKRIEKDLQDLERLVLVRSERRLVLHLVGQFLLVVVWWWQTMLLSMVENGVQAGAVSFQPQLVTGRYSAGSVIF